MNPRPRKIRKYRSPQLKALERIADSLEIISSYICSIEKGLAKSHQKPINVYLEMEGEE
jgi:hypothetical protein